MASRFRARARSQEAAISTLAVRYSLPRSASFRELVCDLSLAGPGICMMDLSDGELVARVRGGDMETYRFLVERYYADCFRFARRVLGSDRDGEEAVHGAFVRAYRFLNHFDENRKFKSWLFDILLDRCRNVAATRFRHHAMLVPVDELKPMETTSDREGRLDLDLQHALMELEPLQREALVLKYAEDWTYDEISEVTGARVSAIKASVQRAQMRLVELMRGLYDVT